MRLIAVVFGVLFLAGTIYAEGDSVLKTERDRVSYTIGLDIGNNLKGQSIDVDPDIFSRGVKDALTGSNPMLTEKEIQETMANFKKEMQIKQATRMKELGEKKKKEGEAFLTKNGKKKGVTTLKSGLQYEVIKEGNGKTPESADTVSVHYRGTLIDGNEFDSSFKRGQPASFQVGGVIKGWTEALQLMKTGAKWKLFIPSDLAYGERGAGRSIGPNETLIFEVELLAIK
ncbi:MAG: FKBP-type peptidyl-prolyl cis-trans isomerase [Nitrospirota bacterium]